MTKNIIVSLTLIAAITAYSAFTFASEQQPEATVLVQTKTHFIFAPPSYRGMHYSRILRDGNVVCVDNNNVTIGVAKLPANVLTNILAEIEILPEKDLEGQESPSCMDAPAVEVSVFKTTGSEVTIKTVFGCKEKSNAWATALMTLAETSETLCSYK